MTVILRPIRSLLPLGKRFISSSARGRSESSVREFKVILDNDTLYVDQSLAEALGWTPQVEASKGVSLTLSGWAPNYFAIAQTGSDAGTRIIPPFASRTDKYLWGVS